MPLDTDFSRKPYFDDFNPGKRFHRVLFRANTAVQNREMIQQQSILQDQIEKFGRQIFTDGSIVEGCSMKFNASLEYVKIADNYANNTAFTIEDFIGKTVESNNGIKAVIVDALPGKLAQAPDLNTLYISYISSATNTTTKRFAADTALTVKSTDGVTIGTVTTVNNAVSGTLANNALGFRGFGYRMSVGEGKIFQKGFFIDVEPQSLIVSKYINGPNDLSVGFNTVEEIVTPEQDTSLLDNAAGYPNYSAPGAHRLRLTPTLTLRQTSSITEADNFFSIVDFVEGQPAIVNQDTSYSNLGKELSRRTDETSGNFIITPFNMRTGVRYNPNNSIDTDNVRLEIDPGLAYVHGYRCETQAKLVNKIRKGTDVRYLNQQVITSTLGNYIFSSEVAGLFNFSALNTVSLRDATAHAVSVNISRGDAVNAISAPGSEIGTANVLSIEYDSGVPGSPSAVYRIYLFNIVMNSGKNFSDVRGLYSINGSDKGFADPVLESGDCVLKEPNLKRLIYPFNQKAIKTLKDADGNINTQFDYKVATSVNFGTPGTGTFTVPTYVGGVNEFPFGVGTLSNESEKDFIIVAQDAVQTANLTGTVTTSGNTVTGTGTSFTTDYIVGETFFVANTTATESRRITAITNTTSMSVANAFTNTYTSVAHGIAYEAGQIIPTMDTAATITIDSSTGATVDFGHTFATSFDASIYYNVRRTVANPTKKILKTSVFVKIDCSNNAAGTTGPWCLGLPDVYSIKHVYVGTTYANTNPDLVSSFNFDSGMSDIYYGLGKLINNGASLSGSNKLLIELQAFTQDTSTGAGFFSVDSYPIDDTGVTANTITTATIPTYVSPIDGSVINLRNAVDFRVYAANTAAVANTDAAATINPTNTLAFSLPAGSFIPAIDSSFEADVQYYVGRYDKVGMTTKGSIVIVEGNPSENPVPPSDIAGGITLATINVPPYPTLNIDEANATKQYSQAISFTYKPNKRYTMADIAGLDARLTQVEYFTALSTLEASAKDMLITNEAGNNRFKHGILCDSFNSHAIGDTLNPQYQIAIDSINSEARPIFEQDLIDLVPVTSSGITVSSNGRLILLQNQKVDAPYILQSYATQKRNPAQDTSYIWTGHVFLSPEGDFMPDVKTNPDVVVNLDDYSNWKYFANDVISAWGTQWGTWNETAAVTTATSTDVNTVATGADGSTIRSVGNTVTTTTTSTQVRTGTQLDIQQVNNDLNLGSYVTDVSLQPYIRAKVVKFNAVSMKPNTRFWAYFDDASVTQYCTATDANFNPTGGNLVSDAFGNVYGTFSIPDNTFRTGERKFSLKDISNLVEDQFVLHSSATATYYGTNLSYAKNNVTINATTGQLYQKSLMDTQTITSSVTNNNIITTVSPPSNPPQVVDSPPNPEDTEDICPYADNIAVFKMDGNADGLTSDQFQICGNLYEQELDPLAQSFPVPQETIGNQDIPAIYVTAVDLFFGDKDPNLGITIMVREMDNGYPSPNIVPFGSIHLTSDQVNVSDDGQTATTVTFAAPLMLETNKSYCIVAKPDGSNPNYTLWTAVLSGSDIATKKPVYANSTVGPMFSSSDDKTWTAYQQEKFKISIYRLTFTTLDATEQFTNDDTEYLKIDSKLGSFAMGERVFFSNNVVISSNVATANANTTVIVANTGVLAANSKIYILSNTHSVAMVANVQSITNSTAFVVNTAPSFTDTNCSLGFLKNAGALTGFVKAINLPANTIYIANSTASNAAYVTTNTYVIGAVSQASANISSVIDMAYNTIMPKFAVSIPNGTAINFSMVGVSNNSTSYASDTANTGLNFAIDTSFIDKERVVMSKTNEIVNKNGTKSLKVYARFTSDSEKISPAIDTSKCGMVAVHNIINDDDNANTVFNSEITNTGLSINRYISKSVTLEDGQDAEDLRVIIGAYKPAGAKIYVYAKLLNALDPESFASKAWTPLYSSDTMVSSKANTQDLNEYTYTLNPSAVDPGDHTGYLNTGNLSILRYTNAGGQVFDTYKTFAIKIVLLGDSSSLVPRVQDMRAICLQSGA